MATEKNGSEEFDSPEEELRYTKRVFEEAIKELHFTRTALDEAVGVLTVISDTSLQLSERLRIHSKALREFDTDPENQ